MDQPSLTWFINRIAEVTRQGQPLDPAVICRDCPERIPEIQVALEKLAPHAGALSLFAPDATLDRPPSFKAKQDSPVSLGLSSILPLGPDLSSSSSSEIAETLAGSSPVSPSFQRSEAPPSFAILDILGRGGMGVVYRARQVKLNRIVALKMILAGSHADETEQQRFLREAEVIAAIQHPGIIQVYEFGTHAGLPYLAMEYCSGGTLAGKLSGTPLSPRDAATYLHQIAEATQAVHDRGIIHRDLKPANVLIQDSLPKITDFGLARPVEGSSGFTQTGALLGTPSYMAPEQAEGKRDLTPSVDVYALGAILYECLTGFPPFRGSTSVETLQQVLSREPVAVRHLRPQVPRDLETICHHCLHKDPAKRYATAKDLADDLQRFLQGEPIHARPVGAIERGIKWIRRRPVIAGLIAVSVLSMVIGTAVSMQYAIVAQQRERDARFSAQLALESEQKAKKAVDLAGQIAVQLVSRILRPIRDIDVGLQQRVPLRPEELSAIEDLARLPVEINRVVMLERILQHPQGVEKLSARMEPALRALIGLDDQRRKTILSQMVFYLKASNLDPKVRYLCARISARLIDPQEPTASQVVEVLLSGIVALPSLPEQIAVVEDLTQLAGRLEEPAAKQFLDRVVKVAETIPPEVLPSLITATTHILPLKNAPVRKEIAHAVSKRVALELGRTTDVNVLWPLLQALRTVGGQVDPKTAGPMLDDLVRLAEKPPVHPFLVEAVSEVFAAFGKILPKDQRERTAGKLASLAIPLVCQNTDTWVLNGLRVSLGYTLPHVPRTEAEKIVGLILTSCEKTNGNELLVLTDSLNLLKAQLSKTRLRESAKAVSKQVQSLSSKGREVDQMNLADVWNRLSPHLPESVRQEHARSVTKAILSLWSKRAAGSPNEALRLAFAHLGPHLDVDMAREVMQLMQRTLDEKATSADLWVIGSLLHNLTNNLETKLALKVGTELLQAVTRQLNRPLVPEQLRNLAGALNGGKVAMNPEEAAKVARKIADECQKQIATTTRPADLQLLGQTLAFILPQLPEKDGGRLATTLGQRITKQVTFERTLDELIQLTEAFLAVGTRVEREVVLSASHAFAASLVRLNAVGADRANPGKKESLYRLFNLVIQDMPPEPLIALLNNPASVGRIEELTLGRLGTVFGTDFRDLWDMVEWTAKNRPEIPLVVPPAMTPPHAGETGKGTHGP